MYSAQINNKTPNNPFHPNNQVKGWEHKKPRFDQLKPLIDRVLQKPVTDAHMPFTPPKNWSFSQCIEQAGRFKKTNAYVINQLLSKIPDIHSFRYFYENTPIVAIDGIFFNRAIKKADQFNDFAQAQAAFLKAKDRNLATVVTFSSYITAAGNAHQFEEAKAAFLEAKDRDLANVVTFSSYITAAGNTNQFGEAKAAFLEAKKRNLANVVTLNGYITAAGNTNQFGEAKAAFLEAKKRNLANVVTFNSFITAADNANQFVEANAAFLEAKDRQLANVVTFSSYITAADNANEFEEAAAAFEEAKDRQLANVVTFSSYITAAGNANQFEEANAAFLKAKESDLANLLTYFSYIDVLIAEDQIDEATRIYNQHIKPTVPVKKILNGWTLDLHGLSHGAAKICVLECFNSLTPQQRMRIITGWGKHSDSGELFEMKNLIKEFLSDKNVTLLEQVKGSLLYEVKKALPMKL